MPAVKSNFYRLGGANDSNMHLRHNKRAHAAFQDGQVKSLDTSDIMALKYIKRIRDTHGTSIVFQ